VDRRKAAQAYYALGRLDDADAWAGRAAEVAARYDAHAQMWRLVKAKVLARRGEHAEAERLARRAVEICRETDVLIDQGLAFADLGEVLALAGRPEAAAEAFEQALAHCERQEYLVLARLDARPRRLFNSEVLFYGLVDLDHNEAIDLFVDHEKAVRALADCVRDEPDWLGRVIVEAIDLGA
jgi:tetratricopeptide (TPR) repeat protein